MPNLSEGHDFLHQSLLYTGCRLDGYNQTHSVIVHEHIVKRISCTSVSSRTARPAISSENRRRYCNYFKLHFFLYEHFLQVYQCNQQMLTEQCVCTTEIQRNPGWDNELLSKIQLGTLYGDLLIQLYFTRRKQRQKKEQIKKKIYLIHVTSTENR